MSKFDEACLLISGENTLKSSNRFAWSELVEKYPGKWIIYTDVEIVNDERLFLCTVLEVCNDDTRSDKKLQYLSNGIKAMAMRTTSDFNGSMGG